MARVGTLTTIQCSAMLQIEREERADGSMAMQRVQTALALALALAPVLALHCS